VTSLVERIEKVLEAGPPLHLAVLFGSEAIGTAGPASDVDLAILPRDPNLALHLELDLAGQLSAALGREVDLVRLDRASTLLRWEIARHGVLVLATPAYEWTRFRASAGSEHAEIADALEAAGRLFRRRLLTSAP
jgi:predicted nucleotidyltransferase